MRIALLALCCAGCLSTPPPAADDVVDIDAGIDAGPCERDPRPSAPCNGFSDFAPQAFPGRPFALRRALVDDVNADGFRDLILVSNAADNQGVFVLLGPIDPAAPQFHAFIDTDIEIGDVAIRDVVGPSACADLTVVGRTVEATPAGVVQVWRYDSTGGGMFNATPLTRGLDFVPAVSDASGGLPVMVTWARVQEGGDDLLIADLDDLRVVRVGGDAEALDAATIEVVWHVVEPPTPGWDSINGVVATAFGDCSLDQVLVAEGFHGHFLEGSSPLGAGPRIEIPNTLTLGTDRVDLDGVAPPDVVVSGANMFAAYLLADDGTELASEVVEGDTAYSAYPDSYRIDAFAVGQLGGGTSPEWVAIDGPDGTGTGPARAILVEGVAVTGAALGGDSPRIFTAFPGGFVPRDLVIADLDAGVPGDEAWVIATDGALLCLRARTTTPGLEICP